MGRLNSLSTAAEPRAKPTNAVCPVLGGKVDPKTSPVTIRGRAYGLCCPDCGSKLTANPDKYLNKDGVPKNESAAGKANQAPEHHMH